MAPPSVIYLEVDRLLLAIRCLLLDCRPLCQDHDVINRPQHPTKDPGMHFRCYVYWRIAHRLCRAAHCRALWWPEVGQCRAPLEANPGTDDGNAFQESIRKKRSVEGRGRVGLMVGRSLFTT